MTTEQREPLYASTAKPWLKYYDQKYIDMPLPKCSAFEYLCHQNKNHLSETALEYYGRKFTFADLFVNVKKTAAAFRALGVKKGDIITVVSVMTPEVIYAFYAVDMIGATLYLVGHEVKSGNYVENAAPCAMCKRMIINAGIKNVIVRDTKEDYHILEVDQWIQEDESLHGTIGY